MAAKAKNKNKAAAKTDDREEIAVKGKATSGTNIGKAREINAAQLSPAQQIEAAKVDAAQQVDAANIDPIERVTGYKLGDANLVSGIDVDASKQGEFRDLQMGLAKQLDAQTRGEGPSLAALQLKDATQQNIKEQLGLANSGQGVNGALAQRAAAYNIGDLNQKAALQAAQVRMAEQLNAQTALGTVTSQGRTSDISLAQSQAEIQLQQALSNQQEKNKFMLAQGELSQQADIANQGAFNTRASNQAQLAQQASIANAAAVNTAAQQQAILNQQASISNQGAVNTSAEQQAALNQQAAIANQGAVNSQAQAQADINAKIRASQIAAGATTAAAGIGASAANNATNAGLYKFNQELAFEMDKYYQGAQSGTVNGNYTTDVNTANATNKLTDDEFDSVGNFGGALAQQQAMNTGKQSATSKAIYN